MVRGAPAQHVGGALGKNGRGAGMRGRSFVGLQGLTIVSDLTGPVSWKTKELSLRDQTPHYAGGHHKSNLASQRVA